MANIIAMSASSLRRVDAVKSELEKAFSPWRILGTDRGRWWALRGPMSPDRIKEVDTVGANTAEQLRGKLEKLKVVASGARRPSLGSVLWHRRPCTERLLTGCSLTARPRSA